MKEFKVLISALFVLILMACGDKRTDERIVSVTIEPQRYFAEKIAGDKFKINCVVPAGQSPETYDPTPQQMVQVGKSQGYLRIGSIGFEQAWMDNIRNNNPGLKVFDLSEGIDLLKRQTSPHAHYVGITPDQKYLYSVDLGADKIVMYEFIDEKLQELGFDKYEVSNYAKKGYESKHNLVYWHFENYYGVGLGSCGKNNHQIIEHSRSLTKYLNGDFKTITIEQSKEEMMFDQVMMSLRLVEGLNLEVFKERYQEDALEIYQDAIDKNKKEGRLVIEDNFLKATKEGLYVLNDILVDFMK